MYVHCVCVCQYPSLLLLQYSSHTPVFPSSPSSLHSSRRLVRAYNQSAATLNLLRGFSTGGYAGLDRIAQWNLDFMTNSDEGKAYMDLVRQGRLRGWGGGLRVEGRGAG